MTQLFSFITLALAAAPLLVSAVPATRFYGKRAASDVVVLSACPFFLFYFI